jgi:hypothetical protein
MLLEFGKFSFEHSTWGQMLLYYNLVNMVIKDDILGKAWETQFTMFNVGKKYWARFVKKWLLQNQPQEVISFLPLVLPLLKTTFQFATTRAFQVGTAQLPLGMVPRTMHIHLTRLAWVRGWVESQVPWCNAHNVRVRAQKVGAPPSLGFSPKIVEC